MSRHEEFPDLRPEIEAAMRAAAGPTAAIIVTFGSRERRRYAAFLREAMRQASTFNGHTMDLEGAWVRLMVFASNLHSPPPPTPTLAEARGADLETPEGRDVVCELLASLEEGVQQ